MAINTKKIISQSLLSVSTCKALKKVTVNDIIKDSGIARQTFYNHFRDMNDLIYWTYFDTLRADIDFLENVGYNEYIRNLFESSKKISDFLYQAIQITGQNALKYAIYEQNYNVYKEYIMRHYGKKVLNDTLEQALSYNAAGEYAIYKKWILGKAAAPTEQASQLIIDFMPEPIKKYLPFTVSDSGQTAVQA